MTSSITLAQCIISTGIMAYLWCGPMARLRRDNYRSSIRRIRDDLFDFMCNNGRDFKNPAYRATRQMLNGLIRGSNYFSVLTFVHAAIMVKKGVKLSPTALSKIGKLPPGALKDKLYEATNQALKEMLAFIFYQRISGLLAVGLLMIFNWLYVACKAPKKNGGNIEGNEFVERPASHLLDNAYVIGSPTLSRGSRAMLANY